MQSFRGTSYALHGGAAHPKLVLIHGVGLSKEMWRAQTEFFAREFYVLTYDILGHGKSHDPPGARSIYDFTAQLDELTRHLGFTSFALAGFSFGALIAQAFAATQPARITRLALLHAVHRRDKTQTAAVRERARIAHEHGAAAAIETALARWFSDEYRATNVAEMNAIRRSFAAHGDGYLKAYRLFAHAETEMADYDPAKINRPALVITGGDDAGSTPEMSRALCDVLPDARLIINPGQRHLAPIEHAQVLNAQLLEFLQN